MTLPLLSRFPGFRLQTAHPNPFVTMDGLLRIVFRMAQDYQVRRFFPGTEQTDKPLLPRPKRKTEEDSGGLGSQEQFPCRMREFLHRLQGSGESPGFSFLSAAGHRVPQSVSASTLQMRFAFPLLQLDRIAQALNESGVVPLLRPELACSSYCLRPGTGTVIRAKPKIGT